MNLELGEFIIMPNHFHCIIIIGDNEFNSGCGVVCNDVVYGDARHGDAMHGVSTAPNKFGPQSKNMASIMRGYKSAVTTSARLILADFGWQSRFHDHIIRNAESIENIQNYIATNPLNCEKDRFYSL